MYYIPNIGYFIHSKPKILKPYIIIILSDSCCSLSQSTQSIPLTTYLIVLGNKTCYSIKDSFDMLNEYFELFVTIVIWLRDSLNN